jgi:hypothetical protein
LQQWINIGFLRKRNFFAENCDLKIITLSPSCWEKAWAWEWAWVRMDPSRNKTIILKYLKALVCDSIWGRFHNYWVWLPRSWFARMMPAWSPWHGYQPPPPTYQDPRYQQRVEEMHNLGGTAPSAPQWLIPDSGFYRQHEHYRKILFNLPVSCVSFIFSSYSRCFMLYVFVLVLRW